MSDTGHDARVIRALDAATRRLEEDERRRAEPIAIVGIGCRFPGGADDPERVLARCSTTASTPSARSRRTAGTSTRSTTPIPTRRQDAAPRRRLPRRHVDRFDAAFFGISPREARQHGPAAAPAARGGVGGARARRVWPRERLRRQRAPACSSAITSSDYGQLLRRGGPTDSTPTTATGNALSVAAGRLSYVLGLQRPEPGGRHRLLVVAGRGPPRLPEPAHRRVRRWRSPAAST